MASISNNLNSGVSSTPEDSRNIPVSSYAPKPERLVSLDVYRGLTIAGMILVTDPGTYSAVYWPLLHANWNGWTPTDMIFPSFLFIAGVSMTLSFASRVKRGATRVQLMGHIVQRGILLFLVGLVLNGFPFFNLHTLRVPGILQRIALCYVCGGFIYLATLKKTTDEVKANVGIIAGAVVAILAGYWALLKFYPVPGFGPGRLDSLGNLGAYIDRHIFGIQHLWPYGLTPGYGVTYDPEGILSTLPALANLLIGILAGEQIRGKLSPLRKCLEFAVVGIILLLAGWLLNPYLPINKRIWTSTFVLFSSGFSLLALAVCYWILDIRRWRWWSFPALVLGTNAIFSFAVSTIITSSLGAIHVQSSGGLLSLHTWAHLHLFATWLSPIHASLAYAIFVVMLNIAIIWPLYRKRIFLRL